MRGSTTRWAGAVDLRLRSCSITPGFRVLRGAVYLTFGNKREVEAMDEEFTPYEAPKSSLEREFNNALEVIPANKWRRFGNFIIDYIAFMVSGGVIGFVVGMLWGRKGIEYMESIPDIVIEL